MDSHRHRPRFLIDANVIEGVGSLLGDLGYDVEYVNRAFAQGTPDLDIDAFARMEGWIILSHDRRFLKLIQQPRFNFDLAVTSGYGRIMLCGPESEQRERLEQTISLIELAHDWAWTHGRRLLLSIGPNWIRYDDRSLAPKTS